MQYIWEFFCEEKYPQVHLSQSENFSPYLELDPLSESGFLEGKIAYNGFYRFGNIFLKLYMQMKDNKELFDVFFDVFSRFLIECDLKSAFTPSEAKKEQIIYELENNFYGGRVVELIQSMGKDIIYDLAHYINLAQQAGGTSVYLFAKVVTALLEAGTVYYDKEKQGHIMLYVGRKRNIQDEKIIELVEDIFLPLGIHNKVLWENHFGILNENTTMLLDELVLI